LFCKNPFDTGTWPDLSPGPDRRFRFISLDIIRVPDRDVAYHGDGQADFQVNGDHVDTSFSHAIAFSLIID
jgi:hypothetical protein